MRLHHTRHVSSVAIVALLCACMSTFASAQPSYDGEYQKTGMGFGPHRLFRLLHKLDVSRDQREAIGEIMDDRRPIMREFMFDMMDGKKALQEILSSENYDPVQVEALAAIQAEKAHSMFIETARSFAEVSAILTTEQRRELAELLEKRPRRWGRRHHDRDETL